MWVFWGIRAIRGTVLLAAFVQIEMLGVPLVVMAEVFMDFAARRIVVIDGLPWNQPSSRPWTRIRAFVVDRRFIFQRVVVHACESFGEMEKTRMRQAAANHPEPFTE